MPEFEPIEARPADPHPAARPKTGHETVVRFAPLGGILSGPIFTRTRDIIAANMTELLDRSEDPARMIRMIIIEMEETLVEVRATAARSIADIKEMRRACNRLDDLQHGWTEKAELALEKGREDLARAALGEKQKAAEMAESLHAELSQIEQVLRGYEADIQRLQAQAAPRPAPGRTPSPAGSRARSPAPGPARCFTAAAPRRLSPSSNCSSAAPTSPKAAPMRLA